MAELVDPANGYQTVSSISSGATAMPGLASKGPAPLHEEVLVFVRRVPDSVVFAATRIDTAREWPDNQLRRVR